MCDLDTGNGIIYVRERGLLRRVNDIVLAETKAVSSCRRTGPLVLRKEHFMFTYNAEGSLRYSAKSLFDISLLFIADNIHHVDSLSGFPEQIGERLFAAAEEKHIFLNPDTAPRALQVFSDAYGEMVLVSLCLRNRFPLLSERINEIKTFHSLKSLDLFGCRLGDSHEIFQHLTANSLASLSQLFIGGNSLSDVGLQRLTTPIRMLKKGLNNLQLLDLSYNPISERAFGYLTCLPKLQNLDVSGTNLKLGTVLKKNIWDLMGLVHSEKPLDIFDHARCKTEGWAEQVIHQWETNATQMQKQKKIEESRTSALRFFGRQKFVRDVLHATPLVWDKEKDDKRQTLHFFKPEANRCTPEIQIPGTTDDHKEPSRYNVKKRQHQLENSDSHHDGPPAKRVSLSALTAEDMDLLNSY
ncbi:leucine-rich repeat-containing protein 42 isoform 2-T2 [Polymixia lowei]